VGNPDQLTRAAQPERKTVGRTVLYGAGTVSMLVISMALSLSLWIAFPWLLLGWSPTLVTSGSMQPLVAPGDVVMIRPVVTGELTPNTVVLYDRPDTGRVLHRILEQLPDGTFRTGGDANASPDSAPVRVEDIKGAAVLAVPWIGRPSLWLYQGRTLTLVAAGSRVNPAEVLLGRMGGRRDGSRTPVNQRLLPESLHELVHGRLAAQSAAAQQRTVKLVKGLS
jgi:signal peptidase I